MPNIRAQIIREPANALPQDRMINVVHFSVLDTDPFGDTDYEALLSDTVNVFANQIGTFTSHPTWGGRIYDMGEAMPREPKHQITGRLPTTGSTGQTPGPWELAACLSFFSERNLPRNRGRIYLGPVVQSQAAAFVPGDILDKGMAIGAGLAAVGGLNVDWCIHSRRDGAFKKVTDYWMDDNWDFISRRDRGATSRRKATTSE